MKKKPDRKFALAVLALVAGAAAAKGLELQKAVALNASGGSSSPPAITRLISGAS